ncbi:MAG: nickel pincer cofactor biosynthesis protein LarB [Deltaproteobacteria bacterium]|nr:nickel pincer cofactor biosynthesis protein LarB [Deltaproteobacteria bacterium]
MNPEKIRQILETVSRGGMTVESALKGLRDLPFEDLGFARLDHHRQLRTGVPEIVFGEKKETGQLLEIVERLWERSDRVLVTRIDEEKGRALVQKFPHGEFLPSPRLFVVGKELKEPKVHGKIMILAAGTADLPVAEEARATSQFLGSPVESIYDVGIAGLHRLLAEVERLRQASVIIAIAGMEGALPSVVAGLVGRPVIAVPTSVGYGTGFRGISALLAMLNSCVPGVTVVNIDNGVGAAVAAHLINKA